MNVTPVLPGHDLTHKLPLSICIAPRDLHALWGLISSLSSSRHEISTLAPQIFKYITAADVKHLFEVGQFLGFLEPEADRWELSINGRDFAGSKHWRLWEPSDNIRTKLRENDCAHYFIDPNIYINRPAVIDLYAGVGGLSLGFSAAGFDVVLAVDNDHHACEAHRRNFPDTFVLQEDVSIFAKDPQAALRAVGLPREKQILGVIGGPPCQGFSYVGERKASDERNLLTEQFIDVVLSLTPDFFVMENVPGLLKSGIVPKFTIYVQRLAKSNGEPASRIVDALPPPPKVPAKRSRQYKQKLVGSTIRSFRAFAEDYYNSHSEAVFGSRESLVFFFEELGRLLHTELGRAYADVKIADKVVADKSKDIAIIALATAMGQNWKHLKTPDKSVRPYFRALVDALTDHHILHDAIISVDAEYDTLPTGKSFKGNTVGPLLWDILERVGPSYDVAVDEKLSAAAFGTPQDRGRLFIVGFRKDLGKSFMFPQATHSLKDDNLQTPPTVLHAIGDLPDIDTMPDLISEHEFDAALLGQPISDFARRMRLELLDKDDMSLPRADWNPYAVDCSNRTTHEAHVVSRLITLEPGKLDRISRKTRLHPDRLAPTLRAGTKANKGSHTAVRPVHYKYRRVISVREGGRLMGYPDWMTFHHTKWHGFRLVGNGVPFQLAHMVAKQIMNLLYTTP